MTLCLGKKQRNAASGNRNCNLDQDLRAIVDCGASAIVSVIEQTELDSLSVSDLGVRAEALGLDWDHLPVVDVSVPDKCFEALWVYAGYRLRRALAEGKKILVHCRGGLGRTGTVVAGFSKSAFLTGAR